MVLGLDLSEEIDLLDLSVLLSVEGLFSSSVSTAGLVGVKLLGSVLLVAGVEQTILLINRDLEVGDSSDLLLSVLSEDNFLVLSEDFPVGESGRSGDLVVHHSLHGFFEMLNELIEHVEDLLLKGGITGSLTSVEISQLHIVSFVINVIVTDISSSSDVRLVVNVTLTVSISDFLELVLFSIECLLGWGNWGIFSRNGEFLGGVVIFL